MAFMAPAALELTGRETSFGLRNVDKELVTQQLEKKKDTS